MANRFIIHNIVTLSLLVLPLLGAVLPARAQPTEQRAGLVVRFGDGRVTTACVRFGEPEINGLILLERSGLPVVVQGSAIGAAICKIGPEGCNFPAESCFCRREGGRSIYWAFYQLDGASWTYAQLGAANMPVRDGTVHGWAWGAGDASGGALPPVLGLEAICGQGSAAPAVIEASPTLEPTAVPPTPEPPPPTIPPPTIEPTNVPPTPAIVGVAPTTSIAPTSMIAAPATRSPALTEVATTTLTAPATRSPALTEAATATLAAMAIEAGVPTSSPALPAGGSAGEEASTTPGTATTTPIPWSYLGFAVLIVLLAGGAFIQARRSPSERE